MNYLNEAQHSQKYTCTICPRQIDEKSNKTAFVYIKVRIAAVLIRSSQEKCKFMLKDGTIDETSANNGIFTSTSVIIKDVYKLKGEYYSSATDQECDFSDISDYSIIVQFDPKNITYFIYEDIESGKTYEEPDASSHAKQQTEKECEDIDVWAKVVEQTTSNCIFHLKLITKESAIALLGTIKPKSRISVDLKYSFQKEGNITDVFRIPELEGIRLQKLIQEYSMIIENIVMLLKELRVTHLTLDEGDYNLRSYMISHLETINPSKLSWRFQQKDYVEHVKSIYELNLSLCEFHIIEKSTSICRYSELKDLIKTQHSMDTYVTKSNMNGNGYVSTNITKCEYFANIF